MQDGKIDLHLHTTASDGSDTPSQLMDKLRDIGITVAAVTDHDTLLGLLALTDEDKRGIKLITGVELSCHANGDDGFDCHILGYGFDPDHESINSAISRGREKRLLKLYKRLEYLKNTHGIELTDDEVSELCGYNSVAKPHLARVIMRHGLAHSVGDAIEKYLKGDKFPDDRIDARMAIDAIKNSGGVAVYAHPLGGEREERLTRDELVRRVDILTRMGISGLECRYSRYCREDSEFLATVALERGLCISGGSDYHGRNKTVRLGALSSDETFIPTVDIVDRAEL